MLKYKGDISKRGLSVASKKRPQKELLAVVSKIEQEPFSRQALWRTVTILSQGVQNPHVRTLEAQAQQRHLGKLFGYSPESLPRTREQAVEQEIKALQNAYAVRQQLLTSCITVRQAAELLGISPQALEEQYQNGLFLGVLWRDRLWFPIWQFDPDSEEGLVPGLLKAYAQLKANGVAPFAAFRWLTQSNTELEHLTPLEALKMGDFTGVLNAAQIVQRAR